jgi:hypothetical protein
VTDDVWRLFAAQHSHATLDCLDRRSPEPRTTDGPGLDAGGTVAAINVGGSWKLNA